MLVEIATWVYLLVVLIVLRSFYTKKPSWREIFSLLEMTSISTFTAVVCFVGFSSLILSDGVMSKYDIETLLGFLRYFSITAILLPAELFLGLLGVHASILVIIGLSKLYQEVKKTA